MRDIQSEDDARGITIDRVGIGNLRIPTNFNDGHRTQTTIATVELTVELQADRRGTHMSRLVQAAGDQLRELDPRDLPIVVKSVRSLLDAHAATIKCVLPVAIEVTAPVSGLKSHNVIDVEFEAQGDRDGSRVTTTVRATTTSLCPCSKEISDYGAHNQRSEITVAVDGLGDDPYPASVDRLYSLITDSGSCPVIPLLKRPDERAVTMRAFDTPVFVEDIIRSMSATLRYEAIPHRISVRNLESIHEHDAVATLEWG